MNKKKNFFFYIKNLPNIFIFFIPLKFHNKFNNNIGKTIGEGTFGKVKMGSHILTGETVAIKILEKERKNYRRY